MGSGGGGKGVDCAEVVDGLCVATLAPFHLWIVSVASGGVVVVVKV